MSSSESSWPSASAAVTTALSNLLRNMVYKMRFVCRGNNYIFKSGRNAH